jgi:xylulokinase
VVAALPQPVLTKELGRTGIWVDSHVARNVWTVVGATVSADQLEWYRREHGQEEKQQAVAAGGVDWDYLLQAAANSPLGAHGVMFLPHMSGCYYPIVDHRSMGAFVGLRNIVSKGDMLRAMLEGLGYQFRQMIEGFATAGVQPQRIVATGGGTQNELMMQNKADVLGRPVEVPRLEESAALGAAILAGIGVGLYRDEEEAFQKIYQPGRIYQPRPEMTAAYERRFKVFEEIYPALKNLHAHLGQLT